MLILWIQYPRFKIQVAWLVPVDPVSFFFFFKFWKENHPLFILVLQFRAILNRIAKQEKAQILGPKFKFKHNHINYVTIGESLTPASSSCCSCLPPPPPPLGPPWALSLQGILAEGAWALQVTVPLVRLGLEIGTLELMQGPREKNCT